VVQSLVVEVELQMPAAVALLQLAANQFLHNRCADSRNGLSVS
jgi:hypothetical protein